MRLSSLQMPPYNTTLSAVLKGVADYYRLDISDVMLTGLSGHAFLMNIHPELCPSGPYIWNFEDYVRLVRNVGLEIEQLGFCDSNTSREDREKLEDALRDRLDKGIPCAMVNMENQLIIGYDEKGFDLIQPWGSDCEGMTPNRLTFGDWTELGNEIHLCFTSYHPVQSIAERDAIIASLNYALNLYKNPDGHTYPPYAVGKNAYTNWITALKNGKANPHGAWWNAMVWFECRKTAALFFREIATKYPPTFELAMVLSEEFEEIADSLKEAGNKDVTFADRALMVEKAAEIEDSCIWRIEKLISIL